MRLFRRVLVLAAIAALGVAAPAEAVPKGKLVIDVKTMLRDVTFAEPGNNPPNDRPDQGESITAFGTVLKKGTNKKIGTLHATQTVTQVLSPGSATEPPELTTLAYGVYHLRGGKLFGMLSAGADPRVTEFGAIVGGTGKYRGARGDFRDRIIEQTEDYQLTRQTIRFTSR